MSSRLRSILCGGLSALACFHATTFAAGLLVDPDPEWKEGEYAMPAPPREAALKPFFVSSTSPNSFMVDTDSLSVGKDGIIRYVLVIRTPGGAENVTFEGIRCTTFERRIYASSHKGGAWAPMKRSEWEPIIDNTYNRPRAALANDYFCDGPAPARDRDEVLRRLDGQLEYINPRKRGI